MNGRPTIGQLHEVLLHEGASCNWKGRMILSTWRVNAGRIIMSNTGVKGISFDVYNGKGRLQIQCTVCGKKFYKALYNVTMDDLWKAEKILNTFMQAAPCAACGEVVTELFDGECIDCK